MIMSFLSSTYGILRILVILFSISCFLFAYKRTLNPLYATVPTENHLTYVFGTALLLPALTPHPPIRISLLAFGILCTLAPNSSYWIAALTARKADPVLGPLTTHAIVLAPVIYMASSMAMNINISFTESGQPGFFDRFIILQSFYQLTTVTAALIWPTFIPKEITDSDIFLAFGGAAIGLSIVISALDLGKDDGATVAQAADIADKSAVPEAKTKGKSKAKQTKTKPDSKLAKPSASSEPAAASKPKKSESFTTPKVMISAVALSFLPAILRYLAAPTLPRPLVEPYKHPTENLRILSSVQSDTGLIVVGEALGARFLRASHSLLGGVWLGERVTGMDGQPPSGFDAQGEPLGDSIYSTFVLQEAARLVDSRSTAPENALIIGLGTGISATAFHRHNLATTIVEIDEAVYNASRQYFGLPDFGSNRVFIQDAKFWVKERKQKFAGTKKGLFDIIVHDCFSGGGVPAQLFTGEFWGDLKGILHPEGVVAINFGGIPSQDPFKHILVTLSRNFPQCRAFHDSLQPISKNDLMNEFINVVIFCTPSKTPMSFRSSVHADYLNSWLRETVLTSLAEREVDLGSMLSLVPPEEQEKGLLTDIQNGLETAQKGQALEHWKVMRDVLPDFVWETY